MKLLSITTITLAISGALMAQSPAAKPDGNPKTAPSTANATEVVNPTTGTIKPEERSLNSQQAAELSQIEDEDSQFSSLLRQMDNLRQAASNFRKQMIFSKACQEAGWPLPKQGDQTGCQGDLARRLIVNLKPDTKK